MASTGGYACVKLGRAVAMVAPSNESVACNCLEAEYLTPHDGPVALQVVVEVDYATWKRIDREHLFSFSRGSVDPAIKQWEFWSDRPVRLTLLASGAWAQLLLRALAPLEELVAALARNDPDALATANWRYLTVVQAQSGKVWRGLRVAGR